MTLRHITSINDLTLEEIETVFSLADRFLAELGGRGNPATASAESTRHLRRLADGDSVL